MGVEHIWYLFGYKNITSYYTIKCKHSYFTSFINLLTLRFVERCLDVGSFIRQKTRCRRCKYLQLKQFSSELYLHCSSEKLSVCITCLSRNFNPEGRGGVTDRPLGHPLITVGVRLFTLSCTVFR